jgi:uncharacterized lipoprotein YajG
MDGVFVEISDMICYHVMQALDTFNTAVVSPIYYVMFTSLTILASIIMFKVTCKVQSTVSTLVNKARVPQMSWIVEQLHVLINK